MPSTVIAGGAPLCPYEGGPFCVDEETTALEDYCCMIPGILRAATALPDDWVNGLDTSDPSSYQLQKRSSLRLPTPALQAAYINIVHVCVTPLPSPPHASS